eukprot:gnl/MRDRNA2_/MRDRNA2_90355_c0_seq1.p1 gnl/MRDRNA2_/MRDRNA2_90355_c0~~gnl/MRDRNA2_/MRDRNA2_90355_c0_seq1.p1  ORF type:complete len:983 (+),score=179.69 gnl/MRDRNA2_/MRDRNA2_90355_c0_seq1:363-2951(+)
MLPSTRVADGDYHDVANHFFPNFDYMYGTSPHDQSAVLQQRFEYFPFSYDRSLGSQSLPGSRSSRDVSPDNIKTSKERGGASPRQQTQAFSLEALTAALPIRDKSSWFTDTIPEGEEVPITKVRSVKKKVQGLGRDDGDDDGGADSQDTAPVSRVESNKNFGKKPSKYSSNHSNHSQLSADDGEGSHREELAVGKIFSRATDSGEGSLTFDESLTFGKKASSVKHNNGPTRQYNIMERGLTNMTLEGDDNLEEGQEEEEDYGVDFEADASASVAVGDFPYVSANSKAQGQDMEEGEKTRKGERNTKDVEVEMPDLLELLEVSCVPTERNSQQRLKKSETQESKRLERLAKRGFTVDIDQIKEEDDHRDHQDQQYGRAKTVHEGDTIVPEYSQEDNMQRAKTIGHLGDVKLQSQDAPLVNPLSHDAPMVKQKSNKAVKKAQHGQVVFDDFHEWCLKKFGNMVRCWRMLDKDGNMRLSKVEFQSGLREHQYCGDTRTLWNLLDRDRSGTISFFHFNPLSVLELASLKQFFDSEFGSTKRAFRALDKDRNGKLTVQEFRAAVKEKGYQTEEPLTYLFKMLDLNKDCSVTEGELEFLDRLDCPEYLGVEPDFEAWNRFKEKMLERGKGNPLTAWRLLDKDASMRLSWSEFKAGCGKLPQLVNSTTYPLPAIWRAMDQNLSGWVSFREFDEVWFTLLARFVKWCNELAGSLQFAFDHLIKSFGKEREGRNYAKDFSERDAHGQHATITRGQFRSAVTSYGVDADEANDLFDGLKAPGKSEGDHSTLSYHEIRFLDKWGKNLDAELEEEEAWAAALQIRRKSKDRNSMRASGGRKGGSKRISAGEVQRVPSQGVVKKKSSSSHQLSHQ